VGVDRHNEHAALAQQHAQAQTDLAEPDHDPKVVAGHHALPDQAGQARVDEPVDEPAGEARGGDQREQDRDRDRDRKPLRTVVDVGLRPTVASDFAEP
jgi:hypothetical protein